MKWDWKVIYFFSSKKIKKNFHFRLHIFKISSSLIKYLFLRLLLTSYVTSSSDAIILFVLYFGLSWVRDQCFPGNSYLCKRILKFYRRKPSSIFFQSVPYHSVRKSLKLFHFPKTTINSHIQSFFLVRVVVYMDWIRRFVL